MSERLLRVVRLMALLALVACGVFPSVVMGADVPDAEAVLRAVVDNLRGGAMEGTYTFVVERPGRTSQYVMEIVTDGDRRGYIRVIAPPRDAGQAFLMSGDDLWVYNSRLGRSLRLPPSGRSNAFFGIGSELQRHRRPRSGKGLRPGSGPVGPGHPRLGIDP